MAHSRIVASKLEADCSHDVTSESFHNRLQRLNIETTPIQPDTALAIVRLVAAGKHRRCFSSAHKL